MSDETTLLPCPFCGGEPEMHYTRPTEGIREGWLIWCHKCHAGGNWHTKEEDAIRTWNTRAGEETAATLGSNQELIDLAHNAWSIAICAMQDMGIPADWGNSVEQGLRKYGIDVDSLPFVVPTSTCEIKRHRCTSCDHEINDDAYYVRVDLGNGTWTAESRHANFCPNCGAKVVKR